MSPLLALAALAATLAALWLPAAFALAGNADDASDALEARLAAGEPVHIHQRDARS